MVEERLRPYDKSCLNEGQSKSPFNPTLIFDEGWLLRSLMQRWKVAPSASALPFLPFPADATIYSKGKFCPPFVPRYRGDQLAEAHTRANGIVGGFSIRGTKTGIEVHADCGYLKVFQAKAYNLIADEATHAPGYDQLSRTVACVINSLLRAGCPLSCDAHIVVLYPADNGKIHSENYSKDYLETKIAMRIEQYGLDPATPFALGWGAVLDPMRLSFVTWESALEESGNQRLMRFYTLCKHFNGRR